VGKIAEKCVYDNLALKLQCHIVKNTLLSCFGDFAHWGGSKRICIFEEHSSEQPIDTIDVFTLFVVFLLLTRNCLFIISIKIFMIYLFIFSGT